MKKLSTIIVLIIISSGLIKINAQNSVIDSLENLLLQHQKKDTTRINLLNETAYKLYSIDFEKTLSYAKEAEKLAHQLNFVKGEAESLRLIGISSLMKGNYPKALEYYHESLKLSEEIENKQGIAKVLHNIGVIHTENGNYTDAFNYSQKSLKINREIGYKRGIANSLINIGLIYTAQHKYFLAIDSYEKALEVYKEDKDDEGVSICLTNIGEVYYFQSNYQQSLEYQKEALRICKELEDKVGICIANENIGAVYLKMNNYDEALNFTLKSLIIANGFNLLDNQKDLYKQLSEIYATGNNYKNAFQNYVLYKELNDRIFNEENIKEIAGLEHQYKYEKEKQKVELIQQKKDAINDQETKRQKTIRNALIVGFILMTLLVLVILLSFLQKKRANRILKSQKDEIENKNKVLFERNEEIQQLNEELSSSNNQLYSQREKLETTLSKLKKTQSQLIQSEKMASVGTFTYGIAHEINNPLNYIVGGKYIIESYIKENIKEHSSNLMPSIEMIETGINRVSGIVKSLNRFSRTNFTDREECNIHSIIDNCLLTINKQTKNKVEIIKIFTDVTNIIIGNEGNLHQAILNILTNAVQAIKTTGKINILTKIEKDNLLIHITDNGTGINKENIKKVTDPFYTTKDPGEGIGLGLSIAYNIINEHSGSILFESDGKTGTTVSVRLPIEIAKP